MVEPVKPHWHQPSHPNYIKVYNPSSPKSDNDNSTNTDTDTLSTSFSAYAVAAIDIPANTVLTDFSSATPAPHTAYSSVQVSETASIELNSDFLYCNHSCDPCVVFDVTEDAQRREARAIRDIKKGEAITFFYPSTEWEMVQGFECQCMTEKCIKDVRGAKFLDKEVLGRYWLSEHVKRLVKKRDGGEQQ